MGPSTVADLIRSNTLSTEMAALDWYLMDNRTSMLIAGGLSSGKTTTLGYLTDFIRPDAKVITIDFTPRPFSGEEHRKWIHVYSQKYVDRYDLLRAALRERPQYIIIDDLLGEEAFTFFQAMSVGYTGLATLDARDVKGVFNYLVGEPRSVPRALLPSVGLVKVQQRLSTAPRAYKDFTKEEPKIRTMNTVEIVGVDTRTDEIITSEPYRWDATEDKYVYTGRTYLLERIARKSGLDFEKVKEQIGTRKDFLELMANSNATHFPIQVIEWIQKFYSDPENALNELKTTQKEQA